MVSSSNLTNIMVALLIRIFLSNKERELWVLKSSQGKRKSKIVRHQKLDWSVLQTKEMLYEIGWEREKELVIQIHLKEGNPCTSHPKPDLCRDSVSPSPLFFSPICSTHVHGMRASGCWTVCQKWPRCTRDCRRQHIAVVPSMVSAARGFRLKHSSVISWLYVPGRQHIPSMLLFLHLQGGG